MSDYRCLEEHGVTNIFKNKEFIQQKFKEKHGVINPSQLDVVKKKKIETCLLNYGVDNPQQSKKIKDKTKITNLEKYGCENVFQNDSIKNRMKRTFQKKYGVKNPSQSDVIKDKKRITYLEKFNSSHYLSSTYRRSYMENIGEWMHLNEKSDYELYSRLVWIETRKNNIKEMSNYDKRGVTGFHLDHKYSIFEGFKNNVPPHIIGGMKNLEFLPFAENCSKGRNCSVTLDEII